MWQLYLASGTRLSAVIAALAAHFVGAHSQRGRCWLQSVHSRCVFRRARDPMAWTAREASITPETAAEVARTGPTSRDLCSSLRAVIDARDRAVLLPATVRFA